MCVRTDSNLITFSQQIGFAQETCNQYDTQLLFLSFPIASVKLKQIQFVVCFSFLVFFRYCLFSDHLWLQNLYCKLLVCLVVLILEIITKKIASWLFSIRLLETRHACNVHKRFGYMPWVIEKTGSFILIEWELKNFKNRTAAITFTFID